MGPPSIEGLAHSGATADQSSYTFSSYGLGTVKAPRTLFIGCMLRKASGGSAPSLSSATIGGQTAEIISNFPQNGSIRSGLALIKLDAALGLGSSADVVLNMSTTFEACAIKGYAVYNYQGHDVDEQKTLSNTTTFSIPVKLDGFGLAWAMAPGATSVDFTWTEFTEDTDAVVESSAFSAASFGPASAAATKAPTAGHGTWQSFGVGVGVY